MAIWVQMFSFELFKILFAIIMLIILIVIIIKG